MPAAWREFWGKGSRFQKPLKYRQKKNEIKLNLKLAFMLFCLTMPTSRGGNKNVGWFSKGKIWS